MADIEINRETDHSITFQYYEDSDGATKRALTGATVYFTVKPNKWDIDDDDSEALITKNVTSHTDAATGLTAIALTDTQTNVQPGKYWYDIVVVESDGSRFKATEGRCTVKPGPTNR
jgi:hypothetical protein